MASIEITEVLPGLSFEEIRAGICSAIRELNEKRIRHQTTNLAMVNVSEVPVHPKTNSKALIISFSDNDNTAPKYVRRVLCRLTKVGKARCRTPEENWYFVKGDLNMA